MPNAEIVKAACAAFDAGNLQCYADFFSDDFQWVGSFPKPLNKKNGSSLFQVGKPRLSLSTIR
jgi:hypothetical protein